MVTTVRFEYVRSEALRKRLLVEMGVPADAKARVYLDLTVEPAELRAELVEALGEPETDYATKEHRYELRVPQTPEISMTHDHRVYTGTKWLVLDEDLVSLEPLRALFAAWIEAHAAEAHLEPESARRRAEADAAHKERLQEEQRKAEAYERFSQEAEARKEAEKAAFEAERATWSAVHGSDHLKRAVAAGYTCTRLYLEERAAVEYPGFVVDMDASADWRSRACPSLAALDLVDALQAQHGEDLRSAEIVWLIQPASADRDDEVYRYDEGREAVVVQDRRYRNHRLVREM